KKVIYYGGSSTSNGLETDTHIFDLATNTWETTANNPGARLNHAMVYDSKNNVTLLYGGRVIIDGVWESLDDTWAFNSQTNNWTNLNPSNKPDVYYHTNHVYDQKHNKFILFGGTDKWGGDWSPEAKGGTWAYDFTLNTWTKLNSTNEPSPRLKGKMYYDPILEKSFLFGGKNSSNNFAETWSFDYASNLWTQIESDVSPSARKNFGLSYDSDQQVAILHGAASDPTWQFTPQALHSVDGPNQANYQYKSNNASLSLNVTIQNATTYDAYLNNELIETTNYQNGTVILNLTSIYTNFSYSNFTIINYTKYEDTNLTILFNSEENTRLSHYVNVTVFDNLPQISNNIFDIDHEIGETQILGFNVSDDNLDQLKVYQNNTQLYSTQFDSSNPILDLNSFIDGSFNLTQYNFTLSFIDSNSNTANQSLLVNIIDTKKPTLSLFTADNYTEYDTDGFIQFQAVDPTLVSYTIAINNITISSGNISSNELIEISNANYSVGEHIVTLSLLDRANNSLVATTSFTVNAYVAPTNTTTTETSTTDTSTTDVSSTTNDTSSPTISDIITSQEPSDGIGGNITIIIMSILGALVGLEFIRRQREMKKVSK
ncbi:MAG: Kelch repeat-containing protein, partial [Candidatus Kariarchaeum pelagius]